MGFEFQWPWMFLALPLPWFIRLIFPQAASSSTIFMPLAADAEAPAVSAQHSTLRWFYLFGLWVLLVCSAARPIYIGEAVDVEQTGRDIFLAVDISGSMREQDMQLDGREVDRLTLVKSVLNDFIAERDGDRLGLILFADQAYIQAPLTPDLNTLNRLLQESEIGFAGRKTAIGDAIGLAVKRLEENQAEQKILILLTDGQNTAGAVAPIKASQVAAQQAVTIYTIGIGSDQTRARGLLNFGRYNPSADLDVQTLTAIAKATNGRFFRATSQQDLQAVYQTINQLQSIEQAQQRFRPVTEYFYWPLLAMLWLYASGALLLLWQARTVTDEETDHA